MRPLGRPQSLFPRARWAVLLAAAAPQTAAAADSATGTGFGDLPPPPRAISSPAEQFLELELVINGRRTGMLAPVTKVHDRFRLRLADLHRAGVRIDAPSDMLFLDEMPGVSARYDQGNQRLAIDVPPGYLPEQRLRGRTRKAAPAAYDTGALLNYDVYVSGGADSPVRASVHHEARVFAAAGTLSTTGVVRSGAKKGYIRYDTRFRRSDEATATTIEVGDLITRTLPWASAVRLGGIQVSRDFSVRPDIITYPLPEFAGSAALPSTVELLVGQQRVAGGTVNPGPFAFESLPPINGAGEANIIVTDMLGRSVQTALPFYVSDQLLAPGLTDYAVSFGAFRENYGIRNFDYGGVAASGSLRHGVTRGITLEVRAEIADDMQLAGGGSVVKLGHFGTLSGSYSRSFRGGEQGDQLTLGYEYQARAFSFAFRHSRRSAHYVDLGLLDAAYLSGARTITSATLSLSMGRAGTLGLGYFDIGGDAGDDTRFANASWSVPLLAGSRLNASATHEFEDKSWSGALTVSIPLGARAGTFSAGVADMAGAPRRWRADYARAIPTEGGFGWSAGASLAEGGIDHWRGDLAWRTDPVQLRAGAYSDRDTTFWAGASGSLVFMDGAVFAANRIADAFAVVSTDGVADIPVRYENQLVGRTNGDGKLLIPWASAYYPAKYAIDPLDLPAHVKLPQVAQSVAIASGGGAVVRFPVESLAAARALITDARGLPLPVGTPVSTADGTTTHVGWDGLLFLEQVRADSLLTAHLPDGSRCTAPIRLPAATPDIVDLGELPCLPAKP